MITLYWTDLVMGAAVAGGIGAICGAVLLVGLAIYDHERRKRRW